MDYIFSCRNFSTCDRLGCEWCSTYCNNQSAIQELHLKRCDYAGKCCEKEEIIVASTETKSRHIITIVLVPVIFIILIMAVIYMYRSGWRVGLKIKSNKPSKKKTSNKVPDVISDTDIEC